MLCKYCKKEIKDGSEFCGHCGAKVQKEPGSSFFTSSNFRIKFVIIVLLVIIALLALPHNEKTSDNKSKDKNGPTKLIDITGPFDTTTGPVDTEIRPVDTSTQPQTGPTTQSPPSTTTRDCFICDGSGKKDCTSCDNGYYIEYENGSYMGYGSAVREVKKKCRVCQGNGWVTCYH